MRETSHAIATHSRKYDPLGSTARYPAKACIEEAELHWRQSTPIHKTDVYTNEASSLLLLILLPLRRIPCICMRALADASPTPSQGPVKMQIRAGRALMQFRNDKAQLERGKAKIYGRASLATAQVVNR